MPADPAAVKAVFLEAADLPPADRAALLAERCAADTDLLRRVHALLAAHDQADGGDETAAYAADGDGTRTIPPSDEAVGQLIAGRYKLIERIGEGGMGSVWLAEQTEPVKRKVAVKLIKPGMDSKAVLARFEAERQALALMDHPNIAKVFDGGLHDGRPYFVMELVKGVPITQFCDARTLTPRQRLELFVPVCQAIQHAHQKGIIHRDIKPANVLIALYDDRPVPKVIDFGVAKATGPTLTEHTLNTGFGGIVGTPQYMSPEQATFNNLDIDTRSDVYALGVLLYELLAGSPPFKANELEKRGLLEMLRVVREDEPPRPSHKLSTADTLPTLAAVRGTEPKRLTGLLRNELDWIVMKALEKDRTRRYETANGFAADVNRYLAGEAVLAHPPSMGYRMKKFVRRNRAQVIAAGLVLFALLAGMAGTTWQAIRAERARADEARQRQLAEAKEREANDERAKAEAEKKKAIAFRDKALDALRATTGTDVEKLLGAKTELTANEKAYLEAIASRWQTFARQEGTDEQSRAIAAEGHFRVAHLWQKLGRRDEARPEYQQAVALYEKLAADFPDFPDYRNVLAATHNNLGLLLADLGKRVEAEEQFRKGLAFDEKLAADFPAVPDYRHALAASHTNLGNLLAGLGKQVEAEEQFQKVLGIGEKLATDFPAVPKYRRDLAQSHTNLGNLLDGLGKRVEAEEQFRKGLANQEKLAADFPAVPKYRIDLGGGYCNFGISVRRTGKPTDSLAWFDKAIQTLRPVHEAEPRDVTAKQYLRNSHWSRAVAYNALGKHAEAVKDWDETIELSPKEEQPARRADRATSRLQAGQVAEAIAEVAELTKSPNWNANQWYDFACSYSVACSKIADKKAEYADRAIELLTKAVKAGWKDAAHMKKDTDFDPLRDREDFKKLLADLEAKPK